MFLAKFAIIAIMAGQPMGNQPVISGQIKEEFQTEEACKDAFQEQAQDILRMAREALTPPQGVQLKMIASCQPKTIGEKID